MKIVAMSDIHAHSNFFVPDGDVLIIAGDLGSYGSLNGCNHFISLLPHKYKILVGGNHDSFLVLGVLKDKFPNIIYLEDSEIIIDGVKFYGAPWHGVCGWPFGLDATERKAKWDKIPNDIDVMITHMPPYGIMDDIGGMPDGCPYLQERVKQISPKLHIFGHVHEHTGTMKIGNTIYANVSLCDGARNLTKTPQIFTI
jgi:Icc-related predicted phosphoesterase